ncbi:hypothetical protein TNCV_4429051 [Trichonephila clavipes]|nr:hypothetical protein TNCV_4429051 [Trichonephila clavipes]
MMVVCARFAFVLGASHCMQPSQRKVGEGCSLDPHSSRPGRVWSLPTPWVGNCPTSDGSAVKRTGSHTEIRSSSEDRNLRL